MGESRGRIWGEGNGWADSSAEESPPGAGEVRVGVGVPRALPLKSREPLDLERERERLLRTTEVVSSGVTVLVPVSDGGNSDLSSVD
jgi:hypothetical protein